MRPSLRFLGVAILGWAGLRAATLGALPGAEVFRISRSEAKPPAIMPTQFPPIEPLAPAQAEFAPMDLRAAAVPIGAMGVIPAGAQAAPMQVYYVPVSSPTVTPAAAGSSAFLPSPRRQLYGAIPALDEWPLSRMAATSLPPLSSSVATLPQSIPVAPSNRMDRLQLSAWALLRSQSGGIAGTPSLGSSASLGASQAGARLIYNWTRQVAASFRTSTEVGRRGGEVAAGLRVQPLLGVPLWLTAERRQRLGLYGGGRSAFALFFEGGVYDQPMPLHLLLDSYLEGGVVGLHSRDRFIDGALTLTRPVYKRFSAGVGVWGGAQRGVYRLDAGPRVTMRVRGNVRVHFDWRQRLAGNAAPGSGPAITLAGDF